MFPNSYVLGFLSNFWKIELKTLCLEFVLIVLIVYNLFYLS